jgi:glycine dehydrogenase
MSVLAHPDSFAARHIGPDEEECRQMLDFLGLASLDALIEKTIPRSIRMQSSLRLPESDGESAVLARLRDIASKNQICRSFLGMGYHDCITPAVIQRNILENPGWYTQYTPYQPEISQGRLEALLNFQTMITDLTGLEIANASLLDEGTAAAEAMHMSHTLHKGDAKAFFVSLSCHPQTIDVVQTRARPLGIRVLLGDHETFGFDVPVFGVLVQYPSTDGTICDYRGLSNARTRRRPWSRSLPIC